MKLRIAILALVVAAVGFLPAATNVAKAKPFTTEPDVYADINVSITDTKIAISDRTANRGNGVNFHVKNTGSKPHNFALLAPRAAIVGLGAEGLSTPTLKPGQSAVLQVFLDYVGTFVYRSTVKADLSKIRMRGKFVVTANSSPAGG